MKRATGKTLDPSANVRACHWRVRVTREPRVVVNELGTVLRIVTKLVFHPITWIQYGNRVIFVSFELMCDLVALTIFANHNNMVLQSKILGFNMEPIEDPICCDLIPCSTPTGGVSCITRVTLGLTPGRMQKMLKVCTILDVCCGSSRLYCSSLTSAACVRIFHGLGPE